MANNNPIGIFDSGVGGLSVLGEVKKLLPNESFIYFGDNANVPYGEKTKEQLVGFSRNILNYFASRNVKMVLMACNTSSAVTLDEIKNDYAFPVLGLIEPTACFVADISDVNIGVIATSATIKSNAYKEKILKYAPEKTIFQTPCPGLVELVEEEKVHTQKAKELVHNYISPMLENKVTKIILGCTHYPFLSDVILDFAQKDDLLINPAQYLAKEAYATLDSSVGFCDEGESFVEFYTSKDPDEFVSVGQKLYPKVDRA
ncbi:MAG: glutamate racemase, partial [Candidatus Gastranaerophilales bacterium]|nr:glutamate racemase [Candidatus Gastranaerophilales bacterium]